MVRLRNAQYIMLSFAGMCTANDNTRSFLDSVKPELSRARYPKRVKGVELRAGGSA